jgi:SAM-dependent methyltransferase
MNCVACGGRQVREFSAREAQLGLGDVFTYSECGSCGSVFLVDPPADLAKYYPPEEYVSFKGTEHQSSSWRTRAKKAALGISLGSPIPDRLASYLPKSLQWFSGMHLSRDSAILDVGCGRGDVLQELASVGFHDLHGTDMFFSPDPRRGFSFYPGEFKDVPGSYDLIMFHHSFEHMTDPDTVLERAKSKLNRGGRLLIRIPLADSDAYRLYGPFWAQLDPPRHMILYTNRSLALVAERAGLTIIRRFYDAGGFGLWGSELYKAGRSLTSKDSFFTSEQLKAYEAQARRNNRSRTGDSAGFILRAVDVPA